MPKKMRRLALRSALSFKVQENGLTVVDAFNFEAPKTKEFKNVLSTLEQPKKVLVVTENEDVNVELSARNIPGVQVTTAQGLNVLDITNADSLVITEAAAKKVEEVLG
ncbi:50S ribosomal protein L4 [Staphylococcus aureus]|nr:50S ribosomal protein L4 [Staphylococcus aureus]